MERTGIVTMRGKPLTLVGPDVKVGDRAPAFTVLDSELNEVRLKDFAGKVKVVSVTPSLDTPVCDLQASPHTARQTLPGRSPSINPLGFACLVLFAVLVGPLAPRRRSPPNS